MAKYRFDCSKYDKKGDPIPGTNHTVDSVIIHCYSFLDRPGEGYYISFNADGKFFFTEEQTKYMPHYWSQDAIIKMAERWSDNGRNLDVEQCSHPGCRNDVGIELIKEES
jgi:hypothetical protein